jgi:penicillin-binding protein 1A
MSLRNRLLIGLAAFFLIAAAGGVLGFYGLRAYYEPQLPTVESLHEIHLGAPLRIFSRDGKLIGEFGAERRIPLPYDKIPPQLIHAFLAAEDDHFFSHPGVDILGLLRASLVLAVTGEKRQGGSTITMQLARNVFLSNERTFDRKFREIFLSLKMERELSKQQILELYLNRIFLGARAYGVGAAAQVYFGKTVDQLTIGEMAVLAGLPKAPSRDNPLNSVTHARERRDYVLRRMHELNYIDDKTWRLALAEPIIAVEHPPRLDVEAGYVAEMVRAEMVARYGEAAYEDGYTVVTTIDSRQQLAAEQAVRKGIYAYEERHAHGGAEGHIPPDAEGELAHPESSPVLQSVLAAQPEPADLTNAIVLAFDGEQLRALTRDDGIVVLRKPEFAWAGFNKRKTLVPGDLIHLRRDDKGAWRLAHIPAAQAAFVALDPHDGAIRALVGGYDYYSGKYNRVMQARRQVGSGFKPFLYTAALADGFTPASVILDAPLVLPDAGTGDQWRPGDYEGTFSGPKRLREALYESLNLVSIRLLQAVGLDYVLDYVPPRFGIPRDRLPDSLTLALGSASLTPMEMARAYSVFANGGFLVDPYLIASIRHGDKQEVFQAQPAVACPQCVDGAPPPAGIKPAPRELPADIDYLITSMLHDVTVRGTAAAARELGRDDLAGKTGTTNDFTDAWFNGFNAGLVGIAWIGYDQPNTLGHGEQGARAALPIWMDFMRVALQGVPSQTLPRPDTIVDALINPANGKRVAQGFPGAISEIFIQDHLPPMDDGHVPGLDNSNLTDVLF